MIRKITIATTLLMASSQALAAYAEGTIMRFKTTASGEIYINLGPSQPQSHDHCKTSDFTLERNFDPVSSNWIAARMLSAYATQEAVKINYSDTQCAMGFLLLLSVE